MTHQEYILSHKDRLRLGIDLIESIILVDLKQLKYNDRLTYEYVKKILSDRQKRAMDKLELCNKPTPVTEPFKSIKYPNLSKSQIDGIKSEVKTEFAQATDGKINTDKLDIEIHRRLIIANDKGGE